MIFILKIGKIIEIIKIIFKIFEFMVELIFQKDNIGLENENKQLQEFFLVPGEGNLILIKFLVINIYNIMILI
jgi:hypothetical protein